MTCTSIPSGVIHYLHHKRYPDHYEKHNIAMVIQRGLSDNTGEIKNFIDLFTATLVALVMGGILTGSIYTAIHMSTSGW